MSFKSTLLAATSALQAQNLRLRVISENIANTESFSGAEGKEPYCRKLVSFESYMSRSSDQEPVTLVRVKDIVPDKTEFEKKYAPDHPAADETGYIKIPNVKPLVEVSDMRTAQRHYEANLNVIETARTLMQETLGILRH